MPYIQTMCPAELKAAMEAGLPLFIAAGSIEYPGSQLPLGTDVLIIEGILREIEKRTPIVVAPPFVYSPTGYMVSGPEEGTVDIGIDPFVAHCAEILRAYSRMGFSSIRLLVHHQGGNIGTLLKTAALKAGAYSLYQELGGGWWTRREAAPHPCRIEVMPAVFGDTVSQAFGGHAGKGETQAILALYPELVHMENLTDQEPWWNETAKDARAQDARREMDQLIDRWVEKLRG